MVCVLAAVVCVGEPVRGQESGRFVQGMSLFRKGDFAGAAKSFASVPKGDPGEVEAQLYLGKSQGQQERSKGMNWYLEVLKKYAVFSGRARRKEYWFFTLINVLISIVLAVVDNVLGTFNREAGAGLIGGIYSLAVLIPSLAVTVRRLHDTNHSGWWLLIGLVPCVGAIVLLIFMVTDSTPGENQYGPNPKAGESYPPNIYSS